MTDSYFYKISKFIWKVFSGISGALGLASMSDNTFKWKSLVKKALDWYSENIYPFFDSLFSLLNINLPQIYYDYLVVGLVISTAIIKYYLLAYYSTFKTHDNFTKQVDKYYSHPHRFELSGKYGKYLSNEEFDQSTDKEWQNVRVYYGSRWERFLIKVRAIFILGYMNEPEWPYTKFIRISFIFSYLSMLFFWPLMLPMWIRKALVDKKLIYKKIYVYSSESQEYVLVPNGQKLSQRKTHYRYDPDSLSYRKTYTKKNAFHFLEILGFVIIGFLLLILISEFF